MYHPASAGELAVPPCTTTRSSARRLVVYYFVRPLPIVGDEDISGTRIEADPMGIAQAESPDLREPAGQFSINARATSVPAMMRRRGPPVTPRS